MTPTNREGRSNTSPSDQDPTLFALLIGVDDYSTFDISAGWPQGSSDLQGARRDALAWWTVLHGLGVATTQVRVLCNPPPPTDEIVGGLDASSLGPATREGIEAGCGWLREQLARNPLHRGLVVYAGHGALGEEGGLVLCPTDCALGTAGGVTRGISYSELADFLAHGAAHPQLTVVVDACHASAGTGGLDDRVRSLQRTPLPTGTPTQRFPNDFPSLMACGPDQSCYEVREGGSWHGAFTWSVLRVLGRWGIVTDVRRNSFAISHTDLIGRTGTLLGALGFTQTPSYQGPPHASRLAFLEPRHSGPRTRADPDPLNPGPGRQLIPDVYDLKSPGGVVIGYFNVTGNVDTERQRANTAGFYYTGSERGLQDLGAFLLAIHVGGAVDWSSLTASFLSANDVFVAVNGADVPSSNVWFEWRRVRADGTEVVEGNLGVVVNLNGMQEVRWVSGPGLAGSLDALGPSEHFKFIKLPSGSDPYAGSDASLAMADDTNSFN